jgi:nickel-dependent lactate racemase
MEIPDANIQTVIEPRELPVLGEPIELLEKALDAPIGCPRLEDGLVERGQKVAMLVTDHQASAFGPEGGLGTYLLDRLNQAGIPNRDITLVSAPGMHGHAKLSNAIGPELIDRVSLYVENNPDDRGDGGPEGLTYLGVTAKGTPVWVNSAVAAADRVIGLGVCGGSLFGFQGGAGIILPGVTGRDTTRHNHAYIMHPRPMAGWGPGNPQREDVQEAGDMAGLSMKIDFTANACFAGYHRKEWPVAVQYVQEHTMTLVEPRADIFVVAPANSGDILSMYMLIEQADACTREGGVVILVVEGTNHRDQPEPRPLDETLAEFEQRTTNWMKNSGDHQPDPTARDRDSFCKHETLMQPFDAITRVVARRLGEPRSTTHVWSHKASLTRKRTFLVTDGIVPELGERWGFAFVTNDFEAALGQAFDELGSNARAAVNAPPRSWALAPQNR